METPKEPWNFCETPEEKCTMNYCDENGCMNRKRAFVSEIEKLETLYRKVSVSERLPNDSGYYFGIDSLGHREYPYFDKEENKWESIWETTHWLEEIPDNTAVIEKLEADKAELLEMCETLMEHLKEEQEYESAITSAAFHLIQKHKQ